jgi:hypothetical protein
MKKWQKSLLVLLTSSLAIGWMAQGEAAVIRVGGHGVTFTTARPVTVVIVNSNGNSFEQQANYDPAVGGINIDTSWAGPGASIFIPDLNTGYVWYNGYWVDREGYYWNGKERVYLSDPQWKEHWRHYWHEHRPHGWHRWGGNWHNHHNEDWHGHGDGWHGERWENRGEGWRGHGEGWHDNQKNPAGAMHREQFDRGHEGMHAEHQGEKAGGGMHDNTRR